MTPLVICPRAVLLSYRGYITTAKHEQNVHAIPTDTHAVKSLTLYARADPKRGRGIRRIRTINFNQVVSIAQKCSKRDKTHKAN